MQDAAVWSPVAMLMAVDGTIFRLVAEAGFFAKFILLLLLAMSVISWGVALDKFSLFRRVERQLLGVRNDIARMESADDLRELKGGQYAGPIMGMVRDCLRIQQRGQERGQSSAEMANEFMRHSEQSGMDALTILEKNLVVLSTTTTVSPFLGLLGTCWGIMISFINIGTAGSASLDVVAPGIAEALIATIAGLSTAIPALVFYNMLTSRLRKVESDMQSFAIGVSELLRRDPRQSRVGS